MMNANQPVRPEDVTPMSRGESCVYCSRAVGTEHAAGCVLRTRTVVVEVRLTLVRSVPEDWPEHTIEFQLNDSSWCASNILSELEATTVEQVNGPEAKPGRCLCSQFEGRFVREATEADERDLGWPPRRELDALRASGTEPS